MSAQSFQLLDPNDEDALHVTRLLNVEERNFARVAKRFIGKDALTRSMPAHLPTPPPDASAEEESAAAAEAERQKQDEERQRLHEDVMLDFAALEHTYARIQTLSASNQEERDRYAAEKVKILETAQAVRHNTSDLRAQLEEAQKTLALRKDYDVLTDKITSNRMLKPREEQHANLEKLSAEIADLEQEGRDYAQTWLDRKEQFDRILAEGRQMLRVIRGEKDEPDKDENMENSEEQEGDGSASKGENSGVGTPRPERGASPLPTANDDASTPSTQANATNKTYGQGTGTATPAADASAAPTPGRIEEMAVRDTEMEDTPHSAPLSDLEEGEAAEDSPEDGEHMDVT